ncbi:MAG: 5'-methylthioadenosine/adenosylhomocysteine nucleosidase [Rhodoferax sp.]|jgi:adenosylhomocysteine nucleosidase|nr:5'-methylthioadenosine/adenosylhomocysteine nucleosidase [Rhodoferax sp.]MBP9059711.1 5'-methylthioadenosine/adenosylhomocysteine nucleosidase [Rhodoferax sp.]MBP9684110.1 5'-methylthioadenosine/adenosylhomocysteine nucleosidase [Rhodoferax sp.]
MTVTAILSALAEEQQGFVDLLEDARCVRRAGREFWIGRLHGQDVVLALSRYGKVAASTTATTLIESFGVDRIVFTGVAGGIGAGVKVGDVVVADGYVQHDMDASPLFPRFEVPLYGQARFDCHPELTSNLLVAAQGFIAQSYAQASAVSDESGVVVHRGLIASGDLFVGSAEKASDLQQALLGAGHVPLAVEMEGAAVAQVCHDYGLPFAAVRTISDRADDQAHVDFMQFVQEVASRYAHGIIRELLELLPK